MRAVKKDNNRQEWNGLKVIGLCNVKRLDVGFNSLAQTAI